MNVNPSQPAPPPLQPGRIDLHSHFIPGVDDGCQDFEQVLQCVRQMKAGGYVGSFCTPHLWQDMFPENTTEHARAWAGQLQQRLRDAGENYRLWPGGELRLDENAIAWMDKHGVPTLGDSRCVLMDFWTPQWPAWADKTFDWLLRQNYQPILAHPERLPCGEELFARLPDLAARGIWLQGNFRCMTGEEGVLPDQVIRRLLREDRYQFLAMDAHRPDTLPGRFDGLKLVEKEFGPDTVHRLTDQAPRRLVLGLP